MKYSALVKAAYLLALIFVLSLTLIVISPKVALAQEDSSDAIQILQNGMDASDQGDKKTAEFFYRDAIRQVLENQDVDVLIVSKTLLADILGNTDEAKELLKQAEAGKTALGNSRGVEGTCGECSNNNNCKPGMSIPGNTGTGECKGSGSLRYCKTPC